MTVLDRLRQLLRSSGGFVAGAASATAVFAMSPALSALDPLAEREVIERAERVRPGAETRKAMLAATPAARPLATGSLALQRNRQLPFAAGPAGAAAPFLLPDATSRWGDTALRCLTQAVYYEAGFEPMAGRRAVAQVVLNRMRHKAFPKSVCGVVYQGHTRPGCQFSFTCDGSLRRRPDPQAWLQAQSVARAALEGYVETSVGLATHYHANYVMPYWAPRLAKLTQIGAHIFYRWHGGWGRPAAYAGHYAGVESIPSAPLRGVAPARAGETMLASVAPAHPGETYRDSPTASFNPDVGGRLNVETGWKLKIAEPAETRSRAADVIRRQSGVASLLEEAAGEAP